MSAAPCSPHGNRRSGSSSSTTSTGTAIPRPCARSAKRSGSPLPRPCTRISRTSSGPACLRRDPTKPRALDLIGHRRESRGDEPAPIEQQKLPLLGQIAAGGPLLAEQNIEDEIAVPEPLGRNADFLLRVKGESMINAGILDGDILVVQRAQDARNGEIVVALVGDDEFADEATVKTFYRDARPRAAPARERRARADLRRPRPDPRQGHRGLPDPLMSRLVPQPHARPGAGRDRPRRQPRMPRLRRVPAQAAGRARVPRVRHAALRRPRSPAIGARIRGAGRVTASSAVERGAEESPDTAGQDAGEIPGGESRRKVEQKANRLRSVSGSSAGKGETVG